MATKITPKKTSEKILGLHYTRISNLLIERIRVFLLPSPKLPCRLLQLRKSGYLRKLLVVGACATLRHRQGHNDALRRWASGMLERKTVKYKFKLTAVALANKVARIVFVLMTRGGQYDDRPVAA
jgi:hypothetical protein